MIETDAGMFQCIGSNSAGSTQAAARLEIATPSKSIVSLYELIKSNVKMEKRTFLAILDEHQNSKLKSIDLGISKWKPSVTLWDFFLLQNYNFLVINRIFRFRMSVLNHFTTFISRFPFFFSYFFYVHLWFSSMIVLHAILRLNICSCGL